MEEAKTVVSKKEDQERQEDLPLTFLTASRLDGFRVESSNSNKRGMEIDTWTPWQTPDSI